MTLISLGSPWLRHLVWHEPGFQTKEIASKPPLSWKLRVRCFKVWFLHCFEDWLSCLFILVFVSLFSGFPWLLDTFYGSFIFRSGELYWWVQVADVHRSANRRALFWTDLAAESVKLGAHISTTDVLVVTWAGRLEPGNSELWSLSLLSCITAFSFSSFPPFLLEVQVHLKLGFFLRPQNPCQPSLPPLSAHNTILLELVLGLQEGKKLGWGQKTLFHFVTNKFILSHNIRPPPIISWRYGDSQRWVSRLANSASLA